MAQKKTSRSSSAKPIQLDVLILGGGIQGLWLLNDLHRHGFSTLLLERRELGGEQTCHSHVYIHQGHLYREVALAERLKQVTPLWAAWLAAHPPRYGVMPSYFGFQNPADAARKTALWSHPRLALPYRTLSSLPAPLSGGTTRTALESSETCLDGEWLVTELSKGVEGLISRIREVENIRLSGTQVEEVEVVMQGGQRLVFQPKAVILTAGAGNQALLERASGGRRSLLGTVQGAQQIRKAYMLVVKGAKGDLDPLTGVFDPSGLFLVSRDLGNEVVWLVSDHRSRPLWFVEDWMVYDARWWLPLVIDALKQLAPSHFVHHPDRLQWGVYEAPKAEGRAIGSIPHEERMEKFGMDNLWAVWPTKLTLAPKVSEEVTAQIQALIGTPTPFASLPPAWRSAQVLPGIAPERWQLTPLMSWDAFRRCYAIP